ncbi:MAG TPA: TetR/AcrR family transcriptional regulator [Anaerolineae bacterium]|nr:TetR/AcrR family transcriptional regulator [Anaerolineae bacterium]
MSHQKGKGAKRLTKKQREAQILDAATKVFASKGFRGATTREIATVAGVSEGTIYNYFDSKYDLLIAMSQRLALESLQQLDQLPPQEDVRAYVTALVRDRFELLTKNMDLIRALMPEVLVDDELRQAYVEQVLSPALYYLGAIIENRTRAGVFRNVDTHVVGRAMIGAVMSFGYLWLQRPSELEQRSQEELVSEVVGLFLDGLRVRPAD